MLTSTQKQLKLPITLKSNTVEIEHGCTCHICKRKTLYDFYVSGDDWKAVTDHEEGEGFWCLDCFFLAALRQGLKPTVTRILFGGDGEGLCAIDSKDSA